MADVNNLEKVLLNASNTAFSSACLQLNKLTSGHLKQFASRRSLALASHNTDSYMDLDVDGNDEGENLVRAMDLLLSESASNVGSIPNANALSSLYLRSTDLSKSAADIIAAEAFKLMAAKKAAKSSGIKQPTQKLVSLPLVTGVDWTVGVTIGSSNSATVQSPCVSVLLHVKSPDGSSHTEGIDMSVHQLKALEASLDEASLALDRA